MSCRERPMRMKMTNMWRKIKKSMLTVHFLDDKGVSIIMRKAGNEMEEQHGRCREIFTRLASRQNYRLYRQPQTRALQAVLFIQRQLLLQMQRVWKWKSNSDNLITDYHCKWQGLTKQWKRQKSRYQPNQKRYIIKVLDWFALVNCKVRSTSREQKLNFDGDGKPADSKKYQEILGNSIYVNDM